MEARYSIVFMAFLATLAMYVERVGFSIAFTELAAIGKLDESAKGAVLSAFFWGYALSQVCVQESMSLDEACPEEPQPGCRFLEAGQHSCMEAE